jgi:hypothetical protein
MKTTVDRQATTLDERRTCFKCLSSRRGSCASSQIFMLQDMAVMQVNHGMTVHASQTNSYWEFGSPENPYLFNL